MALVEGRARTGSLPERLRRYAEVGASAGHPRQDQMDHSVEEGLSLHMSITHFA